MKSLEKKKVVVIGGGTGTYTVLSGLKEYRSMLELAAIVAMTDSGGSTGRLRDEFGYLPVGDARMALTALANGGEEDDELVRKLFLHRFSTNGGISGHNFGNIFLMALTDILGSEEEAILAASRVLRVCGTVLPITNEKVHLVAEYTNGQRIVGEHEIDEPAEEFLNQKIVALSTTPTAHITKKVEAMLTDADLIIFGPGDLYTSVLANCVVEGFKETMQHSRAKVLYISNLMTKRGQTTNMGLKEHVAELARYVGKEPDAVLVNTTPLPDDLLLRYAKEEEYPVAMNLTSTTCRIIEADILGSEEIVRSEGDVLKRSLIRHDSEKLAREILALLP